MPVDGGGAVPLPQPPTTLPGDPSAGPFRTGPALPATVFAAYRKAEAALAVRSPGCHLPWQLLAAIGEVESGQANRGGVDAAGTTYRPILGPALNGNGFAAISDTDGGRYDGDRLWDRAVGPMQFIPSTWAYWGVDANGDGRADPNNVFDAAESAGRYLCAGGRDLGNPAQLDRAILGYNNSGEYLRTVKNWMAHFGSGTATTTPDRPAPAGALTAPSPSPTVPVPATGPTTPSPSASPAPSTGTPTGGPSGTPTGAPTPTASASPSAKPEPECHAECHAQCHPDRYAEHLADRHAQHHPDGHPQHHPDGHPHRHAHHLCHPHGDGDAHRRREPDGHPVGHRHRDAPGARLPDADRHPDRHPVGHRHPEWLLLGRRLPLALGALTTRRVRTEHARNTHGARVTPARAPRSAGAPGRMAVQSSSSSSSG